MNLDTPAYRRLKGRGLRPLAFIIRRWSMVYEAADHLLVLDTTGYSEEYRRFHFRDIQGISVHRTKGWRNRNVLWGTLAGLATATGASLVAGLPGGAWVGYLVLGVAGCFAIPLMLNLVAGPTCVVTVHTALRSDVIPSLGRVKVMAAVLPGIRSRILAAQSGGENTDPGPVVAGAADDPGTAPAPGVAGSPP